MTHSFPNPLADREEEEGDEGDGERALKRSQKQPPAAGMCLEWDTRTGEGVEIIR
jgi:hypothetical protein